MFLRFFSRRWLFTTLLVLAATAVMARLGVWQLDRLAQRQSFNARVQSQVDQPPLDLSAEANGLDLTNMEYRPVVVTGEYDFSRQVALRNQAHDNQWGVNLLTPLKIEGSTGAVLVNRGWIPAEDFNSGDWERYDEPGQVQVRGVLRRSQSKPDFGRRSDAVPAPGEPPLLAWNFANVEGIDRQLPYDLLPVYIQAAPEPGVDLPFRSLPELDLSEGPHMGYAIQWFAFAALLFFGYPFFLRKEEQKSKEARLHAG